MKIINKKCITNKKEIQINVFYKGGYKYIVKIIENTDILVVYKEDMYTQYFERKEFIIDSNIKMFESEKI